MIKLLIYLLSPIHALSSITAIKTLHSNNKVSVSVIVHAPYLSDHFNKQLLDVVIEMLSRFDYVNKIINITPETKNSLALTEDIGKLRRKVIEIIGEDSFTQIYYPHDMEGGLFSILYFVYPDAERICIGDGLGNVYDREFHLSFAKNKKKFKNDNIDRFKRTTVKMASLLKNRIKQLLLVSRKPTVSVWDSATPLPHRAVLVLPIDQSGYYFEKVPLTVCPRSAFLNVLEQIRNSCIGLKAYLAKLSLKHEGKRKYLLLTENLAEGNFLSYKQDVAMYTSVIENCCDIGSVVLVKPHPLETLDRAGMLKKNLKGKFEVVSIDAGFTRFPVELWMDLIFDSTVICMSYPVLSLRFVYGIDVIQYMDDAFIEKWFDSWLWESYKDSLSRYMNPLNNLSTWDGNSVLYAGKSRLRERSCQDE